MSKKWICALLVCALYAGLMAGCAADSGGSTAADGDVSAQEAGERGEAPPVPAAGVLPGVGAENYPRVDGSTANIPLMVALYGAVCGVSDEEAQTLVNASGGTGNVWRNMLYGGADLLLVYEAPESVKTEIQEQGLALEQDPLGCDGLVFLVNTRNSVDSLTLDELRGIYTGQITDWSEVGGEAGPITPYQRNFESGSQTLFLNLLMKGTEAMMPPTELVPGTMGGLIDAVAAFDGSGGAIGYSVYYYAELMYENPDLKLLAVEGVAPSAASIGAREYPLVNDFYTVIRADEPENSPTRMLRDWLLTDAGRELLESVHYVPVSR